MALMLLSSFFSRKPIEGEKVCSVGFLWTHSSRITRKTKMMVSIGGNQENFFV